MEIGTADAGKRLSRLETNPKDPVTKRVNNLVETIQLAIPDSNLDFNEYAITKAEQAVTTFIVK